MKKMIKAGVAPAVAFAAVLLFTLIPAKGPVHVQAAQKKSGTVYVCACMKTKSCPCMSMSKMEGPCACGTKGGPPMKKVPADGAWANHNREALSK